MSTRPKVSDFDGAGSDLETALTQIYGLSKVLMELGVYEETASYLGGQLHDHYEAAQDAFSRIYGLSRYSKDGKAEPVSTGEEPSIAALVETRFRLVKQTEDAVHGLLDDETGNKVVAAMDEAEEALDQRIVDRIPETIADLAAQLRLYRILVAGETRGWTDNRDHRLFRSMEEGLDAMMAAKDGEAQS